ncbi:hypothetical protein Hanom_Chr08g00702321 [Helianthus anomalus]
MPLKSCATNWHFFCSVARVWILCFSDLHSVICGFRVCFMAQIVVFYEFVHFVGKMDFVAEPHPIYMCVLWLKLWCFMTLYTL